MGLLPDKDQRWTLQPSTFAQLAPRLRRLGVGCDVAFFLGRQAFTEEPALVERCLDRLAEALETSPVPAAEWRRVGRILGLDLLARLLGISPVSARRYVRATRGTPDDVAVRLHWLALTIGDLAGAYNEVGIRQWFQRKRTQLDGRTPAQMLSGA
jgi:hypothetical protein